jgi:chorismate mutase / prephenate dehydratase
MDDRLAPLRTRIDAIDADLLRLISERARIAQEVGAIKQETGAPMYRPEREAQVLRNLAQNNPGPLDAESVSTIFASIIAACRALERPLSVSFLGPTGTFSETAMRQQFGTRVQGVPSATIDEVFRAVEAGSCDYGVAPIENSTEGAVSRTLDLLLVTPLVIVGEVSIPVRHNLLTKSGTLDGVTRICAHPQALGQCVGWLNQHAPKLPRDGVASNAEAARLASVDSTVAAIAGELAAQHYGLTAVAEHIQDDPQNRTRFIVLGRQKTTPSGRDKTSLILSVANRAGAVYDMLAPLSEHGVSMTRFESRPARMGTWEYYFYVDIEGHQDEPNIARALAALRETCAFYKSLGSYPAAGR